MARPQAVGGAFGEQFDGAVGNLGNPRHDAGATCPRRRLEAPVAKLQLARWQLAHGRFDLQRLVADRSLPVREVAYRPG